MKLAAKGDLTTDTYKVNGAESETVVRFGWNGSVREIQAFKVENRIAILWHFFANHERGPYAAGMALESRGGVEILVFV